MTMDEFYRRYNLNRTYFAAIAGVGARSLEKFAEGKPIRESTDERIRKAMQIAQKYDLVRPRCDSSNFRGFDSDWYKKILAYEKHFKELLESEG